MAHPTCERPVGVGNSELENRSLQPVDLCASEA